MNNSHLLGLVILGTALLAAAGAWRYGGPGRGPRVAAFFAVFGIAFGYFAFVVDNRMRVVTLHESLVAGSREAKPGTGAPVRTIPFDVEHPGVEHTLMLAPTDRAFLEAGFPADIEFWLEAPDGRPLLPRRTERFEPESATKGSRAGWYSRTWRFTPAVAGRHAVYVSPVTVGIPDIHVRIEDPEKRDGKRMPGY